MPTTLGLPDLLVGRFWLADDEHAVPGRLSLAEGVSPRLELDQWLIPLLREIDQRPDGGRTFVFSGDGPFLERFMVHGALDDGTLVTLVDAFEKRRKVGPGGDRQWLEAQLALLGGHVGGPDELFTQVRLQLRHLDAWAALPGFTFEENDSSPGRVTLAFQGSSHRPISLQGGGQLDLEQTPEVEFSALRGGRVGRSVWLRVVDLPPMTADDLDRRFVTPLSSLLTLATDTGCPPVAIEVATGSHQPWLRIHNSGLQAPADEMRPMYRQLLPLGDLGLDRVAGWLNAVEKLGPLPPVVASAAGGSRGTLETQLLELATVAEGLHRQLFAESRRFSTEQADTVRSAVRAAVEDLDEDVRTAVEGALTHLEDPSFPQRLVQLADCVADAMPGVTGRKNRWKRCVTEIRNEFAHRSYGFLETARISELVTVVESLRWLLTGLLLLETGLPPAELAARIEHHEPYRLFRQQAREWLPRVFQVTNDE